MSILDLHRNPGHAIPWYLLLRDDHGRTAVETVAIRHGAGGVFVAAELVDVPDYMTEVFDFTGYESLAELEEMFETPFDYEPDGSYIMKVTEPQYR